MTKPGGGKGRRKEFVRFFLAEGAEGCAYSASPIFGPLAQLVRALP
jgi:hypothetical protein